MSATMKNPSNGRNTQPSHPSTTANNPSILLDKLNVRRSTPDSEAMASSDDEADLTRHEHSLPAAPTQKPVRRASWLNDTTQPLGQPRKGSFASSSMSPTTSHPSTPSAESGTWSSHVPASAATGIGRGPAGPVSFPWGTGIWNVEGRKDPPSRLTEVLPSPTSSHPGSTGVSMFGADQLASLNPSLSREQPQDPTLPFAIPLHPTPKTYRSQSYSVGQLESEANIPSSGTGITSAFSGRGRGNPHSGLQHRPSRPSMLSEMSNDGNGLGKLKEVEDDDDDSTNGSSHGVQLQDQTKALEILARENAILRQQNYQSSRLRQRSSTNTSIGTFPIGSPYGIQESLPEESDYAIDELDEIGELQANKGILGRRFSEYASGQVPRGPNYSSVENRKLENVKKAYWQSSLGFGGLADIPQSRRHSFADVPTRQGSVSSVGGVEPLSIRDSHLFQENVASQDQQSRYSDISGYPLNEHAASYFRGNALPSRNTEPYPPAYPTPVYQYALNSQYGAGRPQSPHRPIYGMPQPRHNQLLYIVLFKCSRADVFYVQEGTGLSVKPGDLVIVEADRGTDLGTVAQDNVEWAQAKELKEHYAEEHYKWLMMYSQGAVGTADGTGAGLMAASNGMQGSAVGGMGPPNQHGMQEPNSGELKPKIIKRLAQNHEIQALRDKEGNEAKAKRVCMQKVKEHGLHMEILDAEFQMDWKKLTFYYFADAYINFNSLVTDLFKVYKTRIWMSAINPASFASPSLGLQAPSGVGPGAVAASRQPQPDRRPLPQDGGVAQAGRAYGGTFAGGLERSQVSPSAYQQSSFAYGYSPFAAAPRSATATMGGYTTNMLPQMDPFSTYIAQSEYQQMPARFPSPHSAGLGSDSGDFGRQDHGHPTRNDGWMSSFQGLSLNTR